ncbi:MAG: hypothetical protein LBT92_04115 [Rickettsiales bacterium]|jgi:hypothetical protein|nr:hypothetical protein [Rickettsiales bacterium]
MELYLNSLRFPDGLPERFLAYFPNSGVSLAEGVARHNLWNASRESKIEAQDGVRSFQFLLIFPRAGLPEVAANVHFSRGKLAAGPFISADYVRAGSRVDIAIEVLSGEKDVMLEISGVPEEAKIAGARRVSDTAWEMPAAPKAKLLLPDGFDDGIRLGISAYAAKAPARASHFSLILPGSTRPSGYPRSFREVRLDVKEALGAVPKLLHISSDAPICVAEGRRLGRRWIIEGRDEISVRLFGRDGGVARLVLSYIRPDWLGDFEEVVKAIDMDFSHAASAPADYRGCIFCASKQSCPMFRDFMEYVGNGTMLRQLV